MRGWMVLATAANGIVAMKHVVGPGNRFGLVWFLPAERAVERLRIAAGDLLIRGFRFKARPGASGTKPFIAHRPAIFRQAHRWLFELPDNGVGKRWLNSDRDRFIELQSIVTERGLICGAPMISLI